MNKIREILRQKLLLERSHREVSRSVGVSVGYVSVALTRAQQRGLAWTQIEAMDDAALEVTLYGPRNAGHSDRAVPDCAAVHAELRRAGVTLQLLHLEYLEAHPNGYRYTAFCKIYRDWLRRQRPTMRQLHRAGEKMLVDYSGKRPSILDAQTGEVTQVELFIAVLGASNLTYAEATRTQKLGDWIGCHVRALEYFGGVTQAIVPDQLRSGVSAPCAYEPGIQRSYQEFAQHYGSTILPARPGRPRDKAKVEVAVQIAQRWILARLRNQRFFSLSELNARIAELCEQLNDRPMRAYGLSRRALFEKVERTALRALPAERFEHGEWRNARVNIDYHVQFDHHYYSVPHPLVHQQVEIRATDHTVEIFVRGRRVASHARSFQRARFTTVQEHMPAAHQHHAAWTPARMISWAQTVGPSIAAMVETILTERPHPEHGYRSCLGILRLSRKFGVARLEAACKRGLLLGVRSYKSLDSMLTHGLESAPMPSRGRAVCSTRMHENVRGSGYYH